MLKFRWETEFQETEIGKMPKDWEVKPLGKVVTFQRGYDLPLKLMKDGPYPVVKSNGIAGFGGQCDFVILHVGGSEGGKTGFFGKKAA